MELSKDRRDKALIVSLFGDLDYNSHIKLKESLEQALSEKCTPIIIDLAGVDHIDSMGLGLLTKMWKKAHDMQIPLHLASCSKNVEKLIRLVNLDKRIEMFASVDDALKN